MQEVDYIEDDRRVMDAMERTLLRAGISTLDKIDRYIIRHQWTLYKDETHHSQYKYEYSKDIAKRFGIKTMDVVRRRANAIIYLRKFVCNGFLTEYGVKTPKIKP
jgi:DNA-directed RNA polymerase specialized sigma subunit